jgi:nucleotide-binding universal stress UspA family protein
MNKSKTKKVLIALDYNPTAQRVAEVGFAISQAMHAEVVLLHVVKDPTYYSSQEYSPIMGFNGFLNMDPLVSNGFEDLKNASAQFLEKSKQHLGDENIKTMVKEGELHEVILQTAKSLDADLIVIGSHSRKWLENILLGSVAENVLQLTHVPLLIVPTKKQNSD